MKQQIQTAWTKYKTKGFIGIGLILIRELVWDRITGGINQMINQLIPKVPNWIGTLLVWVSQDAFHLVSAAGVIIIVVIFILSYRDEKKLGRGSNIKTDVSLLPVSRENGKYASLRITNNNREKPILCRAIIRKMDWFKQDLNNAEGGEWKPINTEECGPLSWHHGRSDDEGFKKIYVNPEFINIVRISDDMNDRLRGHMIFTFLVERPYLVGKYRVWIDVICKSEEVYKTESWLGCIDQDFTPKLYKLLIKEYEDVKDW